MSEKQENEELIEEQQEKTLYECPMCGKHIPFFYWKGFGWCLCSACGKNVRRTEVPEGSILKRAIPERLEKKKEKKKEARKIVVKKDEDDNSEDEDDSDDEPVYKRKKSSGRGVPFREHKEDSEVLSEVLEQFSVKKRAAEVILARSKRNAIHPTELIQLLMDLDTGIKAKHARYVADEYYYALEHEKREKSEYKGQGGYAVARGSSTQSDGYYSQDVSMRGRVSDLSRESRSPRYQQNQQYTNYPGQMNHNRPINLQDVAKMIEESITKTHERSKMDKMEDLLSKLTTEVVSLKSSPVASNIVTHDQMAKEMGDMIGALKDTLDKKENDSYMKYLEKKSEDQNVTLNRMMDRYEKTITSLKEDSKIPAQVDTSGYKKDETRLVAEGLQLIAQKSPVKELGKIIISLDGGGMIDTKKPQIEDEGSNIYDSLPPDIVVDE